MICIKCGKDGATSRTTLVPSSILPNVTVFTFDLCDRCQKDYVSALQSFHTTFFYNTTINSGPSTQLNICTLVYK